MLMPPDSGTLVVLAFVVLAAVRAMLVDAGPVECGNVVVSSLERGTCYNARLNSTWLHNA